MGDPEIDAQVKTIERRKTKRKVDWIMERFGEERYREIAVEIGKDKSVGDLYEEVYKREIRG